MELIRGKQPRSTRILLYGPEGIGKSTFAAQFPNPIFIDTEGGTDHMDVTRTPQPTSWTMLFEQVRYFIQHSDQLETLVIDTADWAEKLCIEQICAQRKVDGIESFGYGRGYVYLGEEFGRLLNLLNDIIALNINVVFTAHAKMRKFEQPDETGAYDRWELKLSKTTAPLLKEWADMVLFANYKTLVVNVDNQGATKGKNKAQGGRRVMYTAHHPCWDAKNRHGLPDELSFDYAQIARCIPGREVVAKTATTSQAVANAPAPESMKNEVKYWHHAESSCVFTTDTAAEAAEYAAEGHCIEVNRDDYEQLKTMYAQPECAEEPQSTPTSAPDELADIPVALADLMRNDGATVKEIQAAVGAVGYYPADTPIGNYDPAFIMGSLVADWPSVMRKIKELREVGDHFNKNKEDK